MKYNNNIAALTLVAVTLTLPALSLAQTQIHPPATPDYAGIANNLDLSETTVETCFTNTIQGERHTAGERPDGQDMIEVISCLQTANRNLTGAQIDDSIRSNLPTPSQHGK